jgi:hypothetical protein
VAGAAQLGDPQELDPWRQIDRRGTDRVRGHISGDLYGQFGYHPEHDVVGVAGDVAQVMVVHDPPLRLAGGRERDEQLAISATAPVTVWWIVMLVIGGPPSGGW